MYWRRLQSASSAKWQFLRNPHLPKRRSPPSVTELIQQIMSEITDGRPFGNDRPGKHRPNRNGKGIPIYVLCEIREHVSAIAPFRPSGRRTLEDKAPDAPRR